MSASGPSEISRKVEAAVRGLVVFLANYFKTHWLLFRHPISFSAKIIDNPEVSGDHIAPYTYLTFSGFIFTVAIAAIPYGAWEAFNEGLWAFEGIVDSLQQRWNEALSLSTLLLAAFPVLLTASVGSFVFARMFYPEDLRQPIRDISSYAFGFASFFYFQVYIIGSFGFIFQHFGLNLSDVGDSYPEVFVWVTLGGLFLFPVISVAIPILFLIQASRQLEKIHPSKFAYRVWLSQSILSLCFRPFQ